MSSIARKQSRTLTRKLQGFSTPQAMAAIQEMQTRAVADREAMRLEALEHCRKAVEKEIKPRIMGDMMLYILAYMRIKKNHTGKWIHDFMLDFNEFADDLSREETAVDDIKALLWDECGLDVVEMFRECEVASEKMKMKLRHRRIEL